MSAVRIPGGDIWWIDEVGTWHAAGGGYAERFPDCRLLDLTQHQGPWFKEMGMIKVAKLNGVIDIQWDLNHASPLAVRSMFDFLLVYETPGSDQVPVALQYFFGAWNSEYYPSTGEALNRIVDLAACEGYEADECITIANVALENIDDSHKRIIAAYDLWCHANGTMHDEITDEIDAIMQYAILYRPDAYGERFIIKEAGAGCYAAAVLGTDWHTKARGMPTEACYSDETFEAALCQDYPYVMKSGALRLDHIRAFFHLDGDDPIWVNYERLLLPWKSAAGSPLLMCCAEQSQELSVDFLDIAVGSNVLQRG
jgi:hypothetical protein